MRNRLMAVVEVLRWAEPHAWEDDDDDDLQASLVGAASALPAEAACC